MAKFNAEDTHFDDNTGALWLKCVSGVSKPPWKYWPVERFEDYNRTFLEEQQKSAENDREHAESSSKQNRSRKQKKIQPDFSSFEFSEAVEEENDEIPRIILRGRRSEAPVKSREASEEKISVLIENADAENDAEEEMVIFHIFSYPV